MNKEKYRRYLNDLYDNCHNLNYSCIYTIVYYIIVYNI